MLGAIASSGSCRRALWRCRTDGAAAAWEVDCWDARGADGRANVPAYPGARRARSKDFRPLISDDRKEPTASRPLLPARLIAPHLCGFSARNTLLIWEARRRVCQHCRLIYRCDRDWPMQAERRAKRPASAGTLWEHDPRTVALQVSARALAHCRLRAVLRIPAPSVLSAPCGAKPVPLWQSAAESA